MKTTVPWLIAAASGLLMIVAYFVPPAETWQAEVGSWFSILAAIAMVLGGINLFSHHFQKVVDQRPGWGFSAVTLIAFVVTLIVGLGKVNCPPADKYPLYAWSGSYRAEGSVLLWIYQYLYSPLEATMFSLLAFYVTSAAFRAFRAKNFEATLLLVTAFIVLLGQTYAGYVLTAGLPPDLQGFSIPNLTIIIFGVFNTAGQRAMMIGIALGVVATSLKILMGMDRSYLGGDD